MDANSIAFCQPVAELETLSDSDFLRALTWEPGAKKSLVAAANAGDAELFFSKLLKRGWGVAVSKRHRENASLATAPSEATAAEVERTKRLVKLQKSLAAGKKNKQAAGRQVKNLSKWLDGVGVEQQLTVVELQLLLEVMLLVECGLPTEVFAKLWRRTLTESLKLSAELDESAGSQASDAERLMFQGELPWEAGLLFADVGGAEVLREFGQQHLAEQLEDKTDTDGTPQADLLDDIGQWVASFVRAIQWGDDFDNPLWGEEEADRFQQLVGILVPMCGGDGRLPLQNGRANGAVHLLDLAAMTAGWKKHSIPRRYLQSIGTNGRTAGGKRQSSQKRIGTKADRPVVQSDWARLACMRSGWNADDDMLVMTHQSDTPSIELTVGGKPVLSGPWDIDVQVDGEQLVLSSQWTCTRWHSDSDADYIEIQLSFENGLQIERQMLLSRTDSYAVLADVVSGAGDRRIDYVSTLPVVNGLDCDADVPTREMRVGCKGLQVRTFPLGLPDDRVQSTAGSFETVNGGLELKQVAIGGLYAPVILDWQKKRRKQEADWRTVTVSEGGQIQKSDAASGHRLRIGGKHQLLLYRSLQRPKLPRAVLGQHTSNETLLGQFDWEGDVTPILIVE